MNKKQLILALVSDLVSSLVYYDRKEDEDLEVGEIEKAIESGDITVADIAAHFSTAIHKTLDQ